MTTQTKPAIIGTAVTAWGDAFRAISAMPLVAGIGLVIVIVLSFSSFWLITDPYGLATSHWLPVVTLISSAVQGLLLAPLAIAVHRYVLLGEVTDRYPLDPSNPRYVRFAGFAVLVNILWSLPGTIDGLRLDAAQDSSGTALLGLASSVIFIVIIVVVVRRAILFPAIAIDAPGASWKNAQRDTKGSSWRVAWIFVCVAVPAAILGSLLYYVVLQPGINNSSQLVFSLLGAIIEVPAVCACAAAASHIYRARANALEQAAA